MVERIPYVIACATQYLPQTLFGFELIIYLVVSSDYVFLVVKITRHGVLLFYIYWAYAPYSHVPIAVQRPFQYEFMDELY